MRQSGWTVQTSSGQGWDRDVVLSGNPLVRLPKPDGREVTTFQLGPAKSVNACSRCFTCTFDLGERTQCISNQTLITRPPFAANRLTGRVQPCISRSLVGYLARAAPDSYTLSAILERLPQTVAGRAGLATSESVRATTRHTVQ